jgi:hypothetical protein
MKASIPPSLKSFVEVTYLGQSEQRPGKDENESEGASRDVGPPERRSHGFFAVLEVRLHVNKISVSMSVIYTVSIE